jgi:hypothetical protein
MVALEVGQMIESRAIVLIGSAMSKTEVHFLLSVLSPLAAATPMTIVQALAGKNKNLVSAMFADSNAEFIRAMCLYLRSWEGYKGPVNTVFRVHGKKDHVVPCPLSGCKVIEDGGHLLAITHAKETASFLERTNDLV